MSKKLKKLTLLYCSIIASTVLLTACNMDTNVLEGSNIKNINEQMLDIQANNSDKAEGLTGNLTIEQADVVKEYQVWLESIVNELLKEGKLKVNSYLLTDAKIISYGSYTNNGGHVMLEYYDIEAGKPYEVYTDKKDVLISYDSVLSDDLESLNMKHMLNLLTVNTMGFTDFFTDNRLAYELDINYFHNYSRDRLGDPIHSRTIELLSTDELIIIPKEFLPYVKSPYITGTILYNIISK